MSQYFIGLYWDARAEGVASCIDKIQRTYTFLRMIDPSFEEWYRTSDFSKKALLKPISFDQGGVMKLLSEGQTVNALGAEMSELGFLFSLKSAPNYKKAHILSITCNSDFKGVTQAPNTVNIRFSDSKESNHLYESGKIHIIYKSLIGIWNPEKGVILYDNEVLFSEEFRFEQDGRD